MEIAAAVLMSARSSRTVKFGIAEPTRTAGPLCGYCAQRAFRRVGPDAFSSCDDIAQRCFPARRQHAGKRFSPSAAKSGLISERLMRASRRMAEMRRKSLSYTTFDAPRFFQEFHVARSVDLASFVNISRSRRNLLERLRHALVTNIVEFEFIETVPFIDRDRYGPAKDEQRDNEIP
jgi:hypothetical protein